MKKFKIILILLVNLFSCQKDNYKEEYYSNGNLKLKVEVDYKGVPNGLYQEFYDTGEIKLKANYINGISSDTVFNYHKNGIIKEKGVLFNNLREGWWYNYDNKGGLKSQSEYLIIKDSTYKNQSIYFYDNGEVDYDLSWFFTLKIPDTIVLGRNRGEIKYYSPLKSEVKYLLAIVENRYSDIVVKKDTFLEEPNFTKIGIYADKVGLKKVTGVLIEELIDIKEEGNSDSSKFTMKRYKKYFEKEVYVKDTIN